MPTTWPLGWMCSQCRAYPSPQSNTNWMVILIIGSRASGYMNGIKDKAQISRMAPKTSSRFLITCKIHTHIQGIHLPKYADDNGPYQKFAFGIHYLKLNSPAKNEHSHPHKHEQQSQLLVAALHCVRNCLHTNSHHLTIS